MERFIELCIRNRFFVILVMAMVVGWGVWSVVTTPVDAIPDLSDVQVIIASEWMGQSPQEIEDQVTYPISTAMLGVPKVKTVRGFSFFNSSFVYVIFEDGTDLYWARSRVLEYLNALTGGLPPGVKTTLGPDGTGVGWVFQYTVEGMNHSLADLRAIQDWYIRYQLLSIPGVSEIASVGGFRRQYQVDIDPDRLLAYDITIQQIAGAVRRSNQQVGASMLEVAEKEFMIRGLGYLAGLDDIRDTVIATSASGTPVRVGDVAHVHEGPEMRRGIAERDGTGEVVSGVVVMRQGENAREVIRQVKRKIAEIEPGLPEGVRINTIYDRSSLIERAIETLKSTLIKESIAVAVVIAIFLWHAQSSLVAIITLPVGVLVSFIVMRMQGLNANIMSLGGIAVAIGEMVDAAIVMVENVHKTLEHDRAEGRERNRWEVVSESSKQVGPSLFFSLIIIAVSFMPVITLQAQEGRLFRPLAFTKTYAMVAGAILAIALVPVLMGYLIRGKVVDEERNPINRALIAVYKPVILPILRWRWVVIVLAVALVAITLIPLRQLGSEFMPPLYEGDLLYMPSSAPAISATEARKLVQVQDRILKSFPEVKTTLGKMGRAETATDPAPLDMMETVVVLKPRDQWRPGMTPEKLIEEMDTRLRWPGVRNMWTMPIKNRVDMLATGIKTPVGIKIRGANLQQISDVALQVERALRGVPDTRNVYAERLMGGNYIDFEIHRDAIARYGLTVADVQGSIETALGGMPITTTVEGRNRFTVNVRYARELRDDIQSLSRVLIPLPSMGGLGSASGSMAGGGMAGMGGAEMDGMGGIGMGGSSVQTPYVSPLPMPAYAASGIPLSSSGSMGMVSGMGGMSGGMGGMGGSMAGGMSDMDGSTVFMSGMAAGMGGVPVSGLLSPISGSATPMPTVAQPTANIVQIPLGELATIHVRQGPMAINSESGLLQSVVFVDVSTKDIGGYVRRAQQALAQSVTLPAGVYLKWSGQFEYMARAQQRLKVIVPVTIAVIFVLLYLNFKAMSEVLVVMLSLPFAVVGGVWLMYLYRFNMSVAAAVGFIALAGVAVQTAIIMLLFLDISYHKAVASGVPLTKARLYESIVEGAAMRVRPKTMTAATTIFGLAPIFWEEGAGSEVMRRMAAPMVGGLVSSLVLTLIVIPAIYAVWRGWGLEQGEFTQTVAKPTRGRRRFGLIAAAVIVALVLAGAIAYNRLGAGEGSGQLIHSESIDGMNVEVSAPKLRHGKDTEFWVRITDPQGAPITDAGVSMEVYMAAMPSMGMPEMRGGADAQYVKDRYAAKIDVEMGGAWEFRLTVRRGDEVSRAVFPIVLP
ncbi:CusA/CzcA family heavy metal efflux RND transporter [Candidatus Poribacteria bacterium]|nr:CusA/CzcA family heavy metal efflux RND transporter [Candidatus Poribacteria bacterium]